MSKLIITTVGTSIITNKLYETRFENEIKHIREGDNPFDLDVIISSTVNAISNSLNNNRSNEYLSAELASLRAFKNNIELGISSDDVIAIFSTDTSDGRFCGEVNKKVLEKLQWCRVLGPVVIQGLKTKSTEEGEDISQSFKDAGLGKLKEETERLLNGQTYTQKYFNITGGFKATIPFITILAFEKGMSLIYLYEESSDLIIISPPSSGYITSWDELRSLTSQLGG